MAGQGAADGPAALRIDGREVAEYVWRPELPAAIPPRPYLHPVRTLGGTVVTALMPTSHRHHLGVSIALADVDGHNFWGSRTFVPGHGPAWLRNHGTQQHVRWIRRTPTELRHSLRWLSVDGERLLTERRAWTATLAGPVGWALTCEFTLTNETARQLRIQSPATVGRLGAGFGGFFWCAPFVAGSQVATASGTSTDVINGSRSPWLAVAAPGGEWTLVFAGASAETRDDPWFLRTRDYIGVGSALSFHEPLLLGPGEAVARRVAVLVADGLLTPAQSAKLAAGLTQ